MKRNKTFSVPKWQSFWLSVWFLFLWSVWRCTMPLGWSVIPCSCCLADNFLLSDEIIANGFHSCDSDEEDRASHASSSDWTPRPRIGRSLEHDLGCSLPLNNHCPVFKLFFLLQKYWQLVPLNSLEVLTVFCMLFKEFKNEPWNLLYFD